MKIFWGFGNCRIKIRAAGVWQTIELKIDSNSYPVDTRVGYQYTNIYSNRANVVEKIVRAFNVMVIRNDSNQTDMAKMLYFLKRNDFDYINFQLHKCTQSPYLTNLTTYRCVFSEPILNNFVSNFQGAGNTINLNLIVQDSLLVTDDKIKFIPYRETTTGVWNTYPEDSPFSVIAASIKNIGIVTP